MSDKARIRRGAEPPRHRRPVTQPPRRGGQAARGRVAQVAAVLPLPADRARRWGRWLAGLIVLGLVLAGLAALHVPQAAGTAIGNALGSAGLSVRRVEIAGLKHMDRLTIYSAVLDDAPTAMPLVDLAAIRDRLLRFGWVKEARVSRRLPDTLLVDIVERQPAAIWQYRGRLLLVDAAGVPLAPVEPEAMPDLPLLVGQDANLQAPALARLMAAVPSLKPMFAGATWVGGRRWDILFQSGETLALPEGDAESLAAIAKFARMDQVGSLLGRGFLRFDMRVKGKVYARTNLEPGKVAAPIVPALPPIVPAPGQPQAPPTGATAAPDAT